MVLPVFRVNCGASCFWRRCQRLYFSRIKNVMASATWAGDPIRPASSYQIFTAVGGIGELDDRLLQGLRFRKRSHV